MKGSPLAILLDNGTIYLPIADTMPADGQNDRLSFRLPENASYGYRESV